MYSQNVYLLSLDFSGHMLSSLSSVTLGFSWIYPVILFSLVAKVVILFSKDDSSHLFSFLSHHFQFRLLSLWLCLPLSRAGGLSAKNLLSQQRISLPVQGDGGWGLTSREDPGRGRTQRTCISACRVPRTEEHGELQARVAQRVSYDSQQLRMHTCFRRRVWSWATFPWEESTAQLFCLKPIDREQNRNLTPWEGAPRLQQQYVVSYWSPVLLSLFEFNKLLFLKVILLMLVLLPIENK